MAQSPPAPAHRRPSGAPLPAVAERTQRTQRTARTEAAERVVESANLLQGQDHVLIRHEGALYRLQTTRLGKLILTK